MQGHMQAVNITAHLKFEVKSTSAELSATNSVTCKCHVDDFAKGRYDMILKM